MSDIGAFIDAHPYVTFGVFLILYQLAGAPHRWFTLTVKRRDKEAK